MERLTPMMRQYLKIKEQHPDALLFFQLGEFYETFFDDAKRAAKELDIVLTQRDGVPMAGVPLKKAQIYVNRLLKRGYKVALCDQKEDPKRAEGKGKGKSKSKSKSMVRREVVRVVTPGTVLDEDVLEAGRNNYLAAALVESKGTSTALAVCDASTGEFRATALADLEALWAELAKLSPAELIAPPDVLEALPPELAPIARTPRERRSFDAARLAEHFKLAAGEGLGFGLAPLAARAAGGLLDYLLETQNQKELAHLRPPTPYATEETLRIDPFTARNLELVRPLRAEGPQQATLLGVLNRAVTGMGQRLLRRWLLSPLLDRARIEARLDAVEALLEQGLVRAELREALQGVSDLERLAGRLGAKRVTPRDLLALRQSLGKLPDLWLKAQEVQEARPTQEIGEIAKALSGLKLRELADLLERAIRPDAPLTLKEGGIIREGFSPELDALKAQEREAQQRLLSLEARERERTGIPSLKVGYNTVFGYYLEVPKAQTKRVPPDYHRKQTLTAAERYVTPPLKGLEEKILSAQERARELEYQLFCEVRDRAARQTHDLQRLAEAVARLDVFAALAQVAQYHDYTRPTFTDTGTDTERSRVRVQIHIRAGRHPVLETVPGGAFVPNDLDLGEGDRLVVLTGPNMSGKSTYLRQIALISLMAQMGSFVPAREARLPLVDQIFTRVGASDMLASGYSTFMVEMLETAGILRRATERSLILLDEMGRGTSTFDGVSIAWAVCEHLVKRVKAKTLFATHYHELTQLAEQLDGVINMHVRVKEVGGEVVFLHQVVPGAAEGSYGVHVAKLAGLPDEVVREAQTILERILAAKPLEAIEGSKRPQERGPRVIRQLALFRAEEHPSSRRSRSWTSTGSRP